MSHLIHLWPAQPNPANRLTWEEAAQQLEPLKDQPIDLNTLSVFLALGEILANRYPTLAFVADTNFRDALSLSMWPYSQTLPEPKMAAWQLALQLNLLEETKPFVITQAISLGLNVTDEQNKEVYFADGAIITHNNASYCMKGLNAYYQKDYPLALQELMALADTGNDAAQYHLGLMFYYGYGMRQDHLIAYALLRRASTQQTHPQNRLDEVADRLSSALIEQGMALETAMASGGNFSSTLQSAIQSQDELFQQGETALKNGDYPQALALLETVANRGHEVAQFLVAKMYYEGQGVSQDKQKALEWQFRSAQSGFAPAQHNLAQMYEQGLQTEKDTHQALAWYSQAAGSGLEKSKLALQKLQSELGPSALPLEDVIRAAHEGNADAQLELAERFRLGLGIESNLKTARTWLKSAADQGLAEAQYRLAMLHQQGQEVPKNDLLTLKLFRLAAAQHHAHAQYQLACLFASGQCVTKDPIAALALLKLAKKNGFSQPAEWPVKPEELSAVNRLYEELEKSDHFLAALEHHQKQVAQEKAAIGNAVWHGYAASMPSQQNEAKSAIPFKKIGLGFVPFLVWLIVRAAMPSSGSSNLNYDPTICAGPPLTNNVAAIEEAQTKGYQINRQYDCIDKKSFDEVNAEIKQQQEERNEMLDEQRIQLAVAGESALAQARHGFETAIKIKNTQTQPLPNPPSELFIRTDYKYPHHPWLPGFISPSPKTGNRHPAIIWLKGDDSNSPTDFWTAGKENYDALVQDFKSAGVILYFPTLRGGNGNNDGSKEFLLGEIDDVLAAADQLADMDYVDPEHIYLGGHDTGATLALLTAAMKPRFKAVFSIGPVASADSYPASVAGIQFSDYDPMELKLRSPIHWLADVSQPTFIIEGTSGTNNSTDMNALCASADNALLNCIAVADSDHSSALSASSKVIATKIGVGRQPDGDLSLATKDFNQ
ncbi:hypothetical protein JCM14076_26870 [Methylosoma difficile]